MIRPLLLVAATALAVAQPVARARHPFSFEDLIRARRLASFDVSPDGKWLAYDLTVYDPEDGKSSSSLWLMALAGGAPRPLTSGAKHDHDPRFSPDGRELAFLSDRDGTTQIHLLDLSGGEARSLTHLVAGADGLSWSSDGKFLLFLSEVFPDCADEACNRERSQHMEKSKVTGRVIERLLYRHWDAWRDGRRQHLFRVDADGGAARDLTPGNFDVPPFSLGGGPGYGISPDGGFIVYASNHDALEASSTNSDLWEMSATGGAARCLTCDNPAYDGTPGYSPDGRYIAYRAQRIAGYESDRFELRVYDRLTQKSRVLTPGFDDWVEDYTWSTDSKRVYFTSTVKARIPIYEVGMEGAPPSLFVDGVTAGEPYMLPDGSLLFTRVSLTRPTEIYRLPPRPAGAKGPATLADARPLTHINDTLFAEVTMGDVRERWYTGEGGKKVQAWVVLPPGFDEKKKYPALFWVHGGPQGAWEDGWSYRWNPEVLASAGYVVYLPNPRGSTGYGQEFVRGVSRDWGGKVFQDLLRGVDDLESLPYVAKGKVGAAGASFGGYMINWFQGHTDRFAALFCHDGISDLESFYSTEELWFPEFEFEGQPWNSPQYRKLSPIAAAAHFKTPQLIVHGEKDYRIPVEQALLMYSILQKRNVPSKLLLFPDENHWVLKAGNARLWYASMTDWFHRWLGGAPADARALESAYSITR